VRAFGLATEGPGAGLYSGAADMHVRVWDAATSTCSAAVPMNADVGSLLLTAGWLFVGTAAGVVCAWNMSTDARHELVGHTGQVQAIAAALERSLVFSAGQDATVRAWRFNPATSQFEAAGVLSGHTRIISCLLVAGNLLFSGSLDGTVRVWDLDTAACVFAANAHESGVMTLLLWENHLISGGLDGRIRVWKCAAGDALSPGAPPPPLLECVFTHPEQAPEGGAADGAGGASPGGGGATTGAFLPQGGAGGRGAGGRGGRGGGRAAAPPSTPGVLTLCGTVNAAGEPILIASYDDSSLRFFVLPTFEARGRMTLRAPVRALSAVSPGVFVAGDENGGVKVWQWTPPGAAAAAAAAGGSPQLTGGGGGGGGGGGRRRG
jgi:WD40 repeat protein